MNKFKFILVFAPFLLEFSNEDLNFQIPVIPYSFGWPGFQIGRKPKKPPSFQITVEKTKPRILSTLLHNIQHKHYTCQGFFSLFYTFFY